MRAHGCLYQQLSTCWHSLSRRDVRRPRHLRPVHREQSTVQPRFAVLLGLLPRELVLLLEAVSRPTGSPGAGKPLSFAGTFGRVVTQFAGPASQPLRHWRRAPSPCGSWADGIFAGCTTGADWQQVAATLAGALRPHPPPLAPEVAENVVSSLLAAGAGGLGWWRWHRAGAQASGSLRPLRDNFRHNVLDAAVWEADFHKFMGLVRSLGVEALLLKGWSVARLYPAAGLRPCGDIDLCVRPDQLPAAISVLTAAGGRVGFVDLHAGVADLEDRTWDQVVRRSRLVRLSDTDVRILGAEDQLRHLCLHLLRHGAWRPLWLCDVAVVLESLPPAFDWEYCLRGDARLSQWVLCVLGLACRLLGARLNDSAIAARAAKLPRWLPETVLSSWGAAERITEFPPLVSYLRQPLGLWKWARHRLTAQPDRGALQVAHPPFLPAATTRDRPHRLLAGNASAYGAPAPRASRAREARRRPAVRRSPGALGLSGGHGSYSPRPGVPGRGEKNAAPRLSTKRPRPAGGGYAASQGRSRTNRVKPLLCRFRPRRNIIPSPARCSGRPGSGLGSAKQHASR